MFKTAGEKIRRLIVRAKHTIWTEVRIKKIGQNLIPIVALCFWLFAYADPVFMEVWENKTLDMRFRLRGQGKPSGQVVVVAIDEKSIQEIGRWPWSRTKWATLLNKISATQPKVIAFDILFTEKEDVGGRVGNKSKGYSEGDQKFAEAIAEAGNVILGVAFEIPAGYEGATKTFHGEVPFAQSFEYGRIKKIGGGAIEAIGILPPLEPFVDGAMALGHFNILPDGDGVLRREFLWLTYEGEYYPPMSLQLARFYLVIDETKVELRVGEGVRFDKTDIPSDGVGRMMINYYGREESFPFYSAADVYFGRLNPSKLEGKAVLVGVSALGTGDLKVSPYSAGMYGVEKNATVAENIINQKFLYRNQAMQYFHLVAMLVYGLLLWRYLPRLKAFSGAGLAGGIIFIHLALAYGLFIHKGYWIDIVYPVMGVGFTYMSNATFKFFAEEKKAREIRSMFKSYVSPRIVEQLVQNPERLKLGGNRQRVTILFTDVVGFTSYCERHRDNPEYVIAQLNEYLTAMTEVVFKWEGTLDKFVGDAIMVFWGAPFPQENHAELAIRCALHMQQRLSELHQKWKGEGKDIINMGVGINTGDAIVGNIGAEGKKMDYTVIGDSVNLGARLESLTRKYQTPLIISDETYGLIKDLLDADSPQWNDSKETGRKSMTSLSIKALEEVQVKGRTKPVMIYSVVNTKIEGS